MDELRWRTDQELLHVATSKDYGKSTRATARELLVERGVALPDSAFENLTPGRLPAKPEMSASTLRFLIRIGLPIIVLVSLALARWCGPG